MVYYDRDERRGITYLIDPEAVGETAAGRWQGLVIAESDSQDALDEVFKRVDKVLAQVSDPIEIYSPLPKEIPVLRGFARCYCGDVFDEAEGKRIARLKLYEKQKRFQNKVRGQIVATLLLIASAISKQIEK